MGRRRDDKASLEVFYRTHLDEPGVRRRWDIENPGNARAFAEREAALDVMLPGPVAGSRVVEVGCGSGGVLAGWLRRGVRPSDAVGVDVLDFRLREARTRHPEVNVVRASGDALPLATASVDYVLAFTLFSSILDRRTARGVAREMDRVLRPRGAVVLYDFRISRPGSRTRGIRRREVSTMFPGFRAQVRSMTLLPPLARRLGRLTPGLYGPLTHVPWLRTHILVILTKLEA